MALCKALSYSVPVRRLAHRILAVVLGDEGMEIFYTHCATGSCLGYSPGPFCMERSPYLP